MYILYIRALYSIKRLLNIVVVRAEQQAQPQEQQNKEYSSSNKATVVSDSIIPDYLFSGLRRNVRLSGIFISFLGLIPFIQVISIYLTLKSCKEKRGSPY